MFERWQKGSWDIWVMNADGTGEKKLTTDKADNRRPVWSPVDDRIAFGSNRSSRHFAIHTMDPDGSEIVRLTDYDQLEGPPDWSPDGGHLAFVREEGRGKNQTTNIWRIEADGSNPQRLTGNTGDVDVDQAYDSSPAWSPDGERIAFASNRGGNLQIHVMSAADGSGGEQLTFGDVASFSPDWQPVLATEANTLARANTRADTVRAATVVRSSFEMSRTTLVSIALAVLFASIGPAAYAGNEANALDPKRDCARDGHSAVGDKPDPFFLPGPDPDPFYAQPHHFPCLPPGTILDSRMVPFSPAGGVPMPQHPAWHLKFVSADTFGRPIAAVATVVKPMDANAANPPKLLSYQNAENSLGTQCSSSHTLAGGTDNGPNQGATSNWLPALVEEGWTLVIPDHLGPTMSYPVAATSAHITLDAIRAALRFGPLGLKPDTPAALWGYSGGAFPAAWGAGLQHSYAPELNIVGSASGGTPARVEPFFETADGDPIGFPLLLSITIGYTRVYPEFLPRQDLTEAGVAAVEAMRDGCNGDTTDDTPERRTGSYADFVNPPPNTTTAGQAVLAREALVGAGLTPRMPVYLYHAIEDQWLPIDDVDDLFDEWCAAGATVIYNRIPVGEHLASIWTGQPDAMRFLKSVFEGTEFIPAPGSWTCNL